MPDKVLLPCPFCGGEAKIENVGGKKPDGTYSARVYCDNFSVQNHERDNPCPMGLLHQLFYTKSEAIAAWNTRNPVGADIIRQRIALK